MAETKIPKELKYSREHEWLRVEGKSATVGITDHAQHALGDIVFVELPPVGKALKAGEVFGVVESVKAASDCYLPVGGKVVAVNGELAKSPQLVNGDPYGAGWLVKVELTSPAEAGKLLDAAGYQALLAAEKK